MRPSCQSAMGWPCSAAYCSEVTARVFSPVRKASVALRNASPGVCDVTAAVLGDGLPSSARLGATPKASAITAALAKTLNIRIARCLAGAARVSHCAVQGWADLLGVFPDVA